uniref:Uncharacterized protein n=1 Tax=Opuntia streptacantha TaxID=393608 RepID=A0A7C9AGJ0_OPUST
MKPYYPNVTSDFAAPLQLLASLCTKQEGYVKYTSRAIEKEIRVRLQKYMILKQDSKVFGPGNCKPTYFELAPSSANKENLNLYSSSPAGKYSSTKCKLYHVYLSDVSIKFIELW